MNVLQVSLRDLVGERFNGYRLHRSLRERGHGSRMLVVDRKSSDPDVHSFSRAGALLERGLYAAERVTSLQGMLSPFALAFPMRRCFREAQVVHWHMVYPHFVGIPWVAWAARRRPTVWTLHDPWAMTGHCVHPLDCSRWLTGCGKCPDLARNFTVWFDTTALVWKAKRDAYARAPLTLVVASRWMRELVARSPLLSKMPCHVIPFGLDLESWPVLDRRACRERLGIPGDGPAIAFRLPVGGDRNRVTKGVPWLLETLARLELPERATLIVFEGTRGLDPLRARYRIVELGWLDEATRVAEALTAADVFVNPSPAESFGFMALEAMACGTPVIATADTAVVESIRPPESGLAVRFGDCEALGAALSGLLADGPRRTEMGRAGRRRVEADYTHADYVRRHEELYRELAESRGGGRGVA